MKIHLTSAVLSYKVDWGRSPGVGHLPFYFCPHCRVIGRLEHAASPPTNVVSSCIYLPALSPSSYAGASWDFQRKSQRKGSREGPLRPLHRLKRKGLTNRSNTKLIFVFYFLSDNLFIKFIIILLQFRETRRWRYSPCWKRKTAGGNDFCNSRFPLRKN